MGTELHAPRKVIFNPCTDCKGGGLPPQPSTGTCPADAPTHVGTAVVAPPHPPAGALTFAWLAPRALWGEERGVSVAVQTPSGPRARCALWGETRRWAQDGAAVPGAARVRLPPARCVSAWALACLKQGDAGLAGVLQRLRSVCRPRARLGMQRRAPGWTLCCCPAVAECAPSVGETSVPPGAPCLSLCWST